MKHFLSCVAKILTMATAVVIGLWLGDLIHDTLAQTQWYAQLSFTGLVILCLLSVVVAGLTLALTLEHIKSAFRDIGQQCCMKKLR